MGAVEEGLPQEVKDALNGCKESLDALEDVLGPVLSTPWDVLTARLEPLEKAKLNLMIAYAVESLFFIYLKTQGTRTDEHPVTEELNRIKAYMAKLKDAAGGADKEQARLRLNKDAAARFIKSGLGKSSREDKDDDDVDDGAEAAGASTDGGDGASAAKSSSEGSKKKKKKTSASKE